MSHPYKELSDHCFWSKAMTWPSPGHIDPVVSDIKITPDMKIATMGSCFAQHISRHIVRMGLNYFVAESPPPCMDPATADTKGYGVFSARYGNIYTPRQAVQLIDRAYGRFSPVEDVWAHRDVFVDAFRPRIDPQGHLSPSAVRDATAAHLDAVRTMFATSDWLVFTLGLTEGWCSKRDGAVYPLAPGVHGGTFDEADHAFFNLSAQDVSDDLNRFLLRLRLVNPKIRVLLTVSPVPLVATYEGRHVLVSNAYSKAALRVAAEQAERRFEDVHYFPSYEIITSPAAGGRYYADDLRSVTESGVAHVMSVFKKHFVDVECHSVPLFQPTAVIRSTMSDVDCDEEWIEHARQVFEANASIEAL